MAQRTHGPFVYARAAPEAANQMLPSSPVRSDQYVLLSLPHEQRLITSSFPVTTPQPPAGPQTLSFLDLPAEIRNTVYNLVYARSKPIWLTRHQLRTDSEYRIHIGLLLSSKTTYQESRTVLYNTNAFNVKISAAQTLAQIGVRNTSLIRSIGLVESEGLIFETNIFRTTYCPDPMCVWTSILHNFQSLEQLEVGDFKGQFLLEVISRFAYSINHRSSVEIEVVIKVDNNPSTVMTLRQMSGYLHPLDYWKRMNRVVMPSVKVIRLMGTLEIGEVLILDQMKVVGFVLERNSDDILSQNSTSVRYKIKLRDHAQREPQTIRRGQS